jgi:hypothetical protein
MKDIELKVATQAEVEQLKNLSTESLIIWILGASEKKKLKLSIEEIALECWQINPEKHSLRGYPQYPDSFVVMKRIFDMKGRKGLVEGTTSSGFRLTSVSRIRFTEIQEQLKNRRVLKSNSKNAADRTITSIDEGPYKRLVRTPAYQKFIEGKTDQIVESDFLYFYGINWHLSKAIVQGKLRNVDLVVDSFSNKDETLLKVRNFLNSKFESTKNSLIK